MKYLVLFIFSMLLIPTIFADTIEDTNIKIRLHNGTIEMINEEYTGNNQNVTFNIFEIINGSVKEFNFPILFISNKTVQIDLVDKYATCLIEKGTCLTLKGQYDTAWTKCKVDLDECEETYEGENSTICKTELDTCTLRNKEKDLTIGNKQDKIKELEEEEVGTKNTKYIYGAICLVVGYVICLYKKGEIGNQAKETSQSEMNPQQAG